MFFSAIRWVNLPKNEERFFEQIGGEVVEVSSEMDASKLYRLGGSNFHGRLATIFEMIDLQKREGGQNRPRVDY